jgi:nucleotide-binding universal stress UspA family protein
MNSSTNPVAVTRDSTTPSPQSGIPEVVRCELVKRSVLLALCEPSPAIPSLHRALAIAELLDAELHVVQVLPTTIPSNPLFPQRNVDDAMSDVARTWRTSSATRAWIGDVIGDELAEFRMQVRCGDFVAQVASHALAVNAQLIVIPTRGDCGSVVTRLAHASQLPVLVAKPTTGHPTIVAATDLQDAGYPLLRTTAEFGEQLRTPVVAFHNVTPVSMMLNPLSNRPITPRDEGGISARRARLSLVSEHLHLSGQNVACDLDPVEAILREARARRADLVVVGTRPRSWFGRVIGASVAVRVVDRARRSVLVAPLPALESSTARF